MTEPNDYDAGLLNDYGAGKVGWWHDYIRHELERCNEHWRGHYAELRTEKEKAVKVTEARVWVRCLELIQDEIDEGCPDAIQLAKEEILHQQKAADKAQES